jgi:predicted amidophosphoribosyltransferase
MRCGERLDPPEPRLCKEPIDSGLRCPHCKAWTEVNEDYDICALCGESLAQHPCCGEYVHDGACDCDRV